MISFSKTRAIVGLGLFLALPLGCTPFDRAVMDGAAPDGDAASAPDGDAHGNVGGAGGTSAAGAGGSGGTTNDGGGAGSFDAQVGVADDGRLAEVGSESDAEKSEGGSLDGMAAADVPASPDTALAGELGGVCGVDAACKSGHCVGGVCCNTTCVAGCYSCRAIETGAAEGTCAAVKVGLAHANDCATTTTTSCGTDGKCDGKGACRKWIAGTTCGAASCANGTSTSMATPTCDGSGTCSPGQSKSCGSYLCNSTTTACNTTCTSPADCTDTSYCSAAKTCVSRKPVGEVCSATSECLSGSCGGRCCPTAAACTCPQPSSQNALKNPGFDQGVENWNVDVGSGSFAWDEKIDATDCPLSGSVWLGGDSSFSQCVKMPGPGAYNFLVHIRVDMASATCVLEGLTGSDCSGLKSELTRIEWLNVPWSAEPTAVQVLGSNLSVSVTCRVTPYASLGGAYFDMAFLGPSPSRY